MTTEINKIDWAMRSIRFWLDSLEEKLGELEGADMIDVFSPDEQLLKQLCDISDAIEDASTECEGLIESNNERLR